MRPFLFSLLLLALCQMSQAQVSPTAMKDTVNRYFQIGLRYPSPRVQEQAAALRSIIDWTKLGLDGKQNTLPSQAGEAGKFLSTDGTTISWSNVLAGSVPWGNISGTLSSQTDLQSALSARPTISTATINYVPKWIGSSLLGNSTIFDHGSGIVVGGTTNAGWLADFNGTVRTGYLNINQVPGIMKGLLISGDEVFATGNGSSTQGVRIAVGVNRLNNRQMWFGDSDAYGSSTRALFRLQTGNVGYAALDVVTGDGNNRLLTVLATDNSNVGVGYNSINGPTTANYTGKLTVMTATADGNKVGLLIRYNNANAGHFIQARLSDNSMAFGVGADGSITSSALRTSVTAPTTTGTTRMVITDANGQLSFAAIPQSYGLSLASPTAAQQILLLNVGAAGGTATNGIIALRGTSPSVTYTIHHGTTYGTSAGTLRSSTTVSSTGVSTIAFTSSAIPANSFVWLSTSAVSGTIEEFTVRLTVVQ